MHAVIFTWLSIYRSEGVLKIEKAGGAQEYFVFVYIKPINDLNWTVRNFELLNVNSKSTMLYLIQESFTNWQ